MNPITKIHTLLLTPSTDDAGEQKRSKRGGCKYPFPQRLFDLLEYIEMRKPELSCIISWYPSNGKAFQVHDRKAFEKQIQQKMFNQSKYASFNRQLNLWGFKRIPSNHSGGPCYFHPLFQRYDRRLCCTMYRSKGPGITSVAPNKSGNVVSREKGTNPRSISVDFLTTRTRKRDPQHDMTMQEAPPSSSLESRLRRTEQLLDNEKQQGRVEETSGDDSSFISDDKEFQEMIIFLSASDDNVIKYLLES